MPPIASRIATDGICPDTAPIETLPAGTAPSRTDLSVSFTLTSAPA